MGGIYVVSITINSLSVCITLNLLSFDDVKYYDIIIIIKNKILILIIIKVIVILFNNINNNLMVSEIRSHFIWILVLYIYLYSLLHRIDILRILMAKLYIHTEDIIYL